jgi:hypothetical protein
MSASLHTIHPQRRRHGNKLQWCYLGLCGICLYVRFISIVIIIDRGFYDLYDVYDYYFN